MCWDSIGGLPRRDCEELAKHLGQPCGPESTRGGACWEPWEGRRAEWGLKQSSPVLLKACFLWLTLLAHRGVRTEMKSSGSGASQVVLVVKNLPTNVGDIRDAGSIPGLGKSPSLRRARQPTPVFLPGESHGQRSLAGYTVHRVTKSRTQLKRLGTHAQDFID